LDIWFYYARDIYIQRTSSGYVNEQKRKHELAASNPYLGQLLNKKPPPSQTEKDEVDQAVTNKLADIFIELRQS